MKKKLLLPFLLLSVIVLPGCKDDDDENPSADLIKERTELLTNHSWKLKERAYVRPDGTSASITAANGGRPCEFDNIYTFQKDGIYINDEGPTICPNFPQEIKSPYNLSNNGNVIEIKNLNPPKKYILELTSDQLIYKDSIGVAGGGGYYVYTYKFEGI